MKYSDIIKLSQTNLLRSKLRTTLTILAVVIGTFTISLTNGVGNGINAYINKELGNVGVENTLLVQAKQPQAGPAGANSVTKYDPNHKSISGADSPIQLTLADINKIQAINGVQAVIPNEPIQVDYITTGSDKYTANVNQFPEGLNLDMAAGRTINPTADNEITIPVKYVSPLGFASNDDALNKTLTIGYENSKGAEIEKQFTIVGVQQQSILGNSGLYISSGATNAIYNDEIAGIASLQNVYQSLMVKFDKNYTQTQIDQLKNLLDANGYNAKTIQDQIGTVNTIISSVVVILDIFGAIALLAAAFGIVNTLLMSVNERTSEIGLMKALGANSKTVFGIFSIEAAAIGFWGGLIGILLSMGAGAIINRIATDHFLKNFTGFNLLTFPVLPSLAILVGITVLAFIAGSLPSLKASRLDPIKALRYE